MRSERQNLSCEPRRKTHKVGAKKYFYSIERSLLKVKEYDPNYAISVSNFSTQMPDLPLHLLSLWLLYLYLS